MTSPAAAEADPAAPIVGVSARALILGVLLLVAMVRLPTMGFELVYDDHHVIEGNGFLRRPGDLGVLLGPEAAARNVPDAFRPVSVLLDVLSYQAFGLRAGLHHLLSVLLHLGVCALLWAWLRRLGAAAWPAAGIVALFGLLAVPTEAIAVVSFREDLMAAALGLAALVIAEHGDRTEGHRAGWIAAAFALSFLAAGAKLSAAALPLIAVWARFVHPFGPRAPRHAAVLATALGTAAFVAWRVIAFSDAVPYVDDDPTVLAYRVDAASILAASAQIHLGYVQQILLPFGLSPEYPEAAARWSDPATISAATALAGLLALGLALHRRAPVAALAIVGTALAMLPTSNLWPMPNLRADRFTYLPAIFASIGIAAGLYAAGARLRGWRRLVPLVVMLVIQGAVAQATAVTYSNDRRLWTLALRSAPGSARAHGVLGELVLLDWLRTGSRAPALLAEARSHCEIAIHNAPHEGIGWACRARVASATRDHVQAEHDFAAALERTRRWQDSLIAAHAIAAVQADADPQAVLEALAQAQQQFPYAPSLPAAEGRIRHLIGDPEGAHAANLRAMSLRPERWDVALADLELELDVGRAVAANLRWQLDRNLRGRAAADRRRLLQRRLTRGLDHALADR